MSYEDTHLLQVYILAELHVDTKNLETAGRVRDTNVDLTIKPTEWPKSRADGVGSVGGGHEDNV
jgi:hypothetical protein